MSSVAREASYSDGSLLSTIILGEIFETVIFNKLILQWHGIACHLKTHCPRGQGNY